MKATILAIAGLLVGITNISVGQTMSNLTILQRKRAAIEIHKFTNAFNPTNDSPKFLPAHGIAAVALAARDSAELKNLQDAARFARDHPAEFSRLLELQSGFGDLVEINPQSADEKIRTLAYAALASQSKTLIDKYLSDNGFAVGDPIRTAAENEINAMKVAVAKVSSPSISVFASGNIRGIATSNAPEPTRSGTGTIGVTYASQNNIFSAQFSVASTVDTIRSGFGPNILAPLNGKSLKSAVIEYFPRIRSSKNLWGHFYGNFSSSLWEIEKDKIFKNTSTLGMGALVHYRFFEGLIAETEVGLDGEIGLSGRWLDGDVRNLLNNEADKVKFLAAFPTQRSFFLVWRQEFQ